jgi:DNA-binding transcriptional regulator YhcF (GntR family)
MLLLPSHEEQSYHILHNCSTFSITVIVLLSIEPDSPVPIYQQIRDRVVEAIAHGDQPAGSPLPSTRQLAIDLGINFHTVNKAYDNLRREGLVRLGRKSGAVIARDATGGAAATAFIIEWRSRLRTLLAEAAAQGMTAEQIIEAGREVLGQFPPHQQSEDDRS